jgi:predicted amidophosphoribosyltransferase
MDSTEHGAEIARSGRDHKCPKCGANNRADAQWCWQCLDRFPESVAEEAPEEAPEPDLPPEPDPVDSLAEQETLRREAMGELAGIAGDEEIAARFSSILASESPAAAVAGGTQSPNGNGQPTGATTIQEPEVKAVIEGEHGAIEIKGKAITWTCSRCETVNGFERNVCEVCGASFAEVIKEPEEARPEREPNTAALISLFFPGAGHAYLGMWGQAIARGVISLWVVVTAIFAAAQGAPQSTVMALIFGLVSFALWGVSAHDAYRVASNQPSAVLLRDKLFLYLVMGLLLLSVIMVFSLAMGARG